MENYVNEIFFLVINLNPETAARYAVDMFFTIVNLLVAYLILKKLLFKPTMRFLDKRKKAIENDIELGKKTKEIAEEKLSRAKREVDDSVHRATAIVNEARIRAQSQSESILEEAKRQANDIIAAAEAEAKRTRRVMIEQMRDEISDVTVEIASRIIKRNLDPKMQKGMIDDLLSEEMNKRDLQP